MKHPILMVCLCILFVIAYSGFTEKHTPELYKSIPQSDSLVIAEKIDLSAWPEEQLNKVYDAVNTFKANTTNEKEVIFYCELLRINPKLFEKTILNQYEKQFEITPSKKKYILSLRKDLKKIKTDSLPLFKYDEKLYTAAKNYAIKAGNKGITGHVDFNKRVQPFLKNNGCAGESCFYGNKRAWAGFMSLLIDEGVPSLGHRLNYLNITYVYIGVAYAPHIEYGNNLVMDFTCEKK